MKVKKFMSTILLLIVAFVTSLTFKLANNAVEIVSQPNATNMSVKINKLLLTLFTLSIVSVTFATSAFADYTITVPQDTALTSSASGPGTYSGSALVKIAGNIDDDEQLCVSVPSSVTMSNGRDIANVLVNTSSKTIWSKDEVADGEAQNDYNFSAALTSGSWNGTATFNVSVGKIFNIFVGDNSVSLISSNDNITRIEFESDNDTVASVDSTGHLVGKAAGTATIKKIVYDSTGGNVQYTTTYTVNVANKITVIYDANGSTFANGSKQNTVLYTPVKTDVVKTSKTANVSDDGTTFSGGYGNNKAATDTITIPGAKQLEVTITYATESTSYDWVCVYDKTVTPSSSNYSSSISGKCGGAQRTTKTFTVTGDTVQFYFRSDSSNDNYFGYYAVVKGTGQTMSCISGSYAEPTAIANGKHFEGWYTDAGCTIGNEFVLENISDSVSVITVYAKWEEDYIAKGLTGGVSWKLYQSGLLRIYPTNGISGTMDNSIGYKSSGYSGFEWNNYNESIKSVVVDKGVSTNRDVRFLLSQCKNLTNIDIGNLNTSNATDMSYMFYYCNALKALDASGFNTTNVTTMSHMFYYCTALESLDVSGFNTAKVTDMSYMFYYCDVLKTLDVSGFNTAKVTNMSFMFRLCCHLKTLDLSNFNTANVTNMESMFNRCTHLETLDISSFNTANVTNMNLMFERDKSLTSLVLKNFDTGKVTDMSFMFSGCDSLTNLDVSSFNTANVTNMKYMFSECISLTTLNVTNFNTAKVTNMNEMFGNCGSLTILDVSGFDTTNVTDMSRMFYYRTLNNKNFTKLIVGPKFATSNLPTPGWDYGLFYWGTSTYIEPLSLTIIGAASDALKNYDFAADGRTVTFVASLQNITASSSVIDDEVAPDNEATVNSDIVTSETECESEALPKEAEPNKTPDANDGTDNITSTLGNSELDESLFHATDNETAESRPEEETDLMVA